MHISKHNSGRPAPITQLQRKNGVEARLAAARSHLYYMQLSLHSFLQHTGNADQLKTTHTATKG